VAPPKSERVFVGGGGGTGPPGPAGPPGEGSVPTSTALTRDANGNVQTVTAEGKPTWTISRAPDGSVASLSNGTTDVAVNRDEDGNVEGTTVTEL
jgi:hypothetical protein